MSLQDTYYSAHDAPDVNQASVAGFEVDDDGAARKDAGSHLGVLRPPRDLGLLVLSTLGTDQKVIPVLSDLVGRSPR